jgi:hypothetical protein
MSGGVDPTYHEPSVEDRLRDDGRYPPDWSARVAAVYERQDGRCWSCAEAVSDPDALVVARAQAIEDGGDHRLTNLVGRCRRCDSLGADVVEWHRHAFVPADRKTTVVETGKDEDDESRPFSWPGFLVGLAVVVVGYVYGTQGAAPFEPVLDPVVGAVTAGFDAAVGRVNASIAGTPVDWFDLGAVFLAVVYLVWRRVR